MSWIICPDEKNGLLDLYPGAAVAYSLRNLTGRSGAAAPVVRVRRSSDNTEQDFTAAQITDGTLIAFCGAGDGFVRTWYDQSGNNRPAAQTTTTSQPQLVAAGSVLGAGGLPAIQFEVNNANTNIHLSLPSYTQSQPFSIFAAANRASALDRQVLFANADATLQFASHVEGEVRMGAGILLSYQGAATTGTQLHSASFNDVNSVAAYNGSAVTGSTGTNEITAGSRISGLAASSQYSWIGLVHELLIYPSDQSANRVAIEASINAHYGIF